VVCEIEVDAEPSTVTDLPVEGSNATATPQPAQGYLGIRLDDPWAELAEREELAGGEGVYVVGVSPDGPAAKAGVQSGDVILQANTRQMRMGSELVDLAAETPVGESVELLLRRNGQTRTVFVVVEQRPEDYRHPQSAPTLGPPRLPYFGYKLDGGFEGQVETIAQYTNFAGLSQIHWPQTASVLEEARRCGLKVILCVFKRECLQKEERIWQFLEEYPGTVFGVLWDAQGISRGGIDAFGRKLKKRFPEAQYWVFYHGFYPEDASLGRDVDAVVMECTTTTVGELRREVAELLPKTRAYAKGRPIVVCWNAWDDSPPGKVPRCRTGVFREYVNLALRERLHGVYFVSYGWPVRRGNRIHGISTRPELVQEIKDLAGELRIAR
jgi:hypothetical protein